MKKIVICLIISLFIALALTLLSPLPFFQTIENKLYDLQMILRDQPIQDERILFVEMDEESIQNIGRWPWPRDYNAFIIDTLMSLGARQILFDVTFSQPSQLIVNNEATKHIFKGKDQIREFINQEIINAKNNVEPSSDDVVWTLGQINQGFNAFADMSQAKLANALKDTDEILGRSFKESKAFIGYKFEVLTNEIDINKDVAYSKIRDDFKKAIAENSKIEFAQLSKSISGFKSFENKDIKSLFLKIKIYSLLKGNIQASFDSIASELNKDKEKIRSEYNSAKKLLAEERIFEFLNANKNAKFIEVIWNYEITDDSTIKIFKNTWEDVKKEFDASNKFSEVKPDNQRFFKAIKFDPPISQFSNMVSGGGFLNGIQDDDGVLRSVPLFLEYKEKIYPHIAISSMIDFLKPEKTSFILNKYLIFHKAKLNGKTKDISIPINKDGTILINWTGKWIDTFKHISCADIYRLYYLRQSVLNDPENPNKEIILAQIKEQENRLRKIVENSISIIGLTAAGTHDYNPIPYEAAYPMVGTHANVINSILNEDFIVRSTNRFNLFVLIFLSIILGLILPFLSSFGGLFFSFFTTLGIVIFSLQMFNNGNAISLAAPLFLSLFSFLGITIYKFSTEEKEKRWVKKAFGQYVSPDVIEDIVKDPSKLQLGGVKKELTVLFSDIRSFTTYSEKRQPEEVVSVLNEYLDAMTEVVFQNKGTLDKYVGDEIMALFGAPKWEPPEISAKQAVITACKMLDRLKELHKKWESEGLEPMDIGIGINTGDMVVGNMGSNLRMDYTVIGDAVNLGARVEALTRNYDSHLIVTEATYNYVKDIVDARQLEAIKVKGKDIPVMIYDIRGLIK